MMLYRRSGRGNKHITFVAVLAVAIFTFFPPRDASSAEDGVWVVEQSANNVVIKLSADGWKELVRIKGLEVPTDIDIDPRDGSVWITDTAHSRVVRYSSDGTKQLASIEKICHVPYHSALDLENNVIWIASSGQGEIVKSTFQGEEILRIKGLGDLHEIVISPFDKSVWVGDKTDGKFAHFTPDGRKTGFTERRLGTPVHMAIDPSSGILWATFQKPGRVVKYSPEGKILEMLEGLIKPYGVTIDPVDHSAWVTDISRGELVNISPGGSEIRERIGGFDKCRGLSPIDEKDGTFWMGNWGAGEAVKLSTKGEILERIYVGGNPRLVTPYVERGPER